MTTQTEIPAEIAKLVQAGLAQIAAEQEAEAQRKAEKERQEALARRELVELFVSSVRTSVPDALLPYIDWHASLADASDYNLRRGSNVRMEVIIPGLAPIGIHFEFHVISTYKVPAAVMSYALDDDDTAVKGGATWRWDWGERFVAERFVSALAYACSQGGHYRSLEAEADEERAARAQRQAERQAEHEKDLNGLITEAEPAPEPPKELTAADYIKSAENSLVFSNAETATARVLVAIAKLLQERL